MDHRSIDFFSEHIQQLAKIYEVVGEFLEGDIVSPEIKASI